MAKITVIGTANDLTWADGTLPMSLHRQCGASAQLVRTVSSLRGGSITSHRTLRVKGGLTALAEVAANDDNFDVDSSTIMAFEVDSNISISGSYANASSARYLGTYPNAAAAFAAHPEALASAAAPAINTPVAAPFSPVQQ